MRRYTVLFLTLSLTALCGAEVEWPSDFWSQVAGSPAAAVPVPMTSAETGFAYTSRCETVKGFATAQKPFDSLITDEDDYGFTLNSFPRPLVIICR